MKAVYIHGFAGSIHSDTITNLRKYYPDIEWCPLEVNHLVDESVAKINDFIGKKLVINPVLNPMSSLKKAVGINKYRGRRENGEKEFKLTMQDLFRFKAFKPKDTPNTLCHYTQHDPNLGEDIKREYQKFFAHAEMTPHLRSHFTDEHYIKHKLGEIFHK